MLQLFFLQSSSPSVFTIIVLTIFGLSMLSIILYYSLNMLDVGFVLLFRKPLYVHFYLKRKKLTPSQRKILHQKFKFYRILPSKYKRFFEHRMVSFIAKKDFIGREGFIITDEVKVLISATAVMLTFGQRNYSMSIVKKIIIYPDVFYSNTNKNLHKGEFNLRLKALVFSWKDFKEGYDIENDNLNLGVHEFAHAIHFNSITNRDVSSLIFVDNYNELLEMLSNQRLISKIQSTEYFRAYAFTNNMELIAVFIEYFIESPQELRNMYPDIYFKIKHMLNFNFNGY